MSAPAPASSLASATRVSRGYTALAALGSLALLVMLVRLAIFAQAPAPLPAIGWSVTPWNAFVTRHACTTAYWRAATEVTRAPDVYAPSTYSTGRKGPDGREIPLFIGPYAVDPYEYPPTFLPLPRVLTLVTPGFPAFRLLWGLLTLGVVVAAVALVARRIDRDNGTRSLWLAPLALVPLSVFHVFQSGNAQLFFVALAMLGMLAFERGRHALGGLLLAYAIVGKLFPGLLVIYLASRRDWRALAWTTGWAVAVTLVTLADIGWAPFAAFLEHLPKLLSGEAFPMLRMQGPPDVNQSVPGLVLKLHRFGGPVLPFEALKVAGWIFSAVIVWATVRLALRPVAPRLAPLAWLVILGLATLRSPFLPGYGAFQGAWVAAIRLALTWTDGRLRVVVLVAWASMLWMTAGPPTLAPTVIAAITTLQTGAILLLFWLAIRTGRGAATPAPEVTAASA
jgi:alpha-1,2-mannosyltransferase